MPGSLGPTTASPLAAAQAAALNAAGIGRGLQVAALLQPAQNPLPAPPRPLPVPGQPAISNGAFAPSGQPVMSANALAPSGQPVNTAAIPTASGQPVSLAGTPAANAPQQGLSMAAPVPAQPTSANETGMGIGAPAAVAKDSATAAAETRLPLVADKASGLPVSAVDGHLLAVSEPAQPDLKGAGPMTANGQPDGSPPLLTAPKAAQPGAGDRRDGTPAPAGQPGIEASKQPGGMTVQQGGPSVLVQLMGGAGGLATPSVPPGRVMSIFPDGPKS